MGSSVLGYGNMGCQVSMLGIKLDTVLAKNQYLKGNYHILWTDLVESRLKLIIIMKNKGF